jgi:hypothetical protein
MKRTVLVILLISINCVIAYSQSGSVNFMGKNITFGSSPDILTEYSDFKLFNDENKFENIKVYRKYNEGPAAYGNRYFSKIYFKFYNDKLFEIYIHNFSAPNEYVKIIENLLSQFKVVKEKSSDDNEDDEGVWLYQELSKDFLKGVYEVGDGDGEIFICNDTEILNEVIKKYSDYGK